MKGSLTPARRRVPTLAVGLALAALLAAGGRCLGAAFRVSPSATARCGNAGSTVAGAGASALALRQTVPAAHSRDFSAAVRWGQDERKKERVSQSDDGFIMPQSAEEEKELQEKQGFWRSEYDDLPDSEKIQNPLVIFTVIVCILPFAWGSSILFFQGGLESLG
mmetsp:Transcript_5924/g.14049  ORF Transcript_5924/g.14049 Transcript_5924/m.14049 type:complete len:164 (+) Transcript_5924:68-559(+)